MRTLVIVVALLAAGLVAYNSMKKKPKPATEAVAERTAREMERLTAEMNRKLPQSNGVVQVQRAEYSQGVLRLQASLLTPRPVDDRDKAEFERRLRELYCRDKGLVDAKVSIEYDISGVKLASISDRVTDQSFRTTAGPQHCR